MHSRRSFTLNSANSFNRLCLIALSLWLLTTSLRADVCVWRDPERTMQRIFPRAHDYKTITVNMAGKVPAIEKQLGAKMDESEKGEFNYYEIIGDGQKIGTIMALAGKGEYGVIEVVIGLDGSGKIVGAYIQRSRERVTKALESPEFLNQFAGKTKTSGLDGKEIKPASPDAEAASHIVTFAIKKMLVFYDVLKKP